MGKQGLGFLCHAGDKRFYVDAEIQVDKVVFDGQREPLFGVRFVDGSAYQFFGEDDKQFR